MTKKVVRRIVFFVLAILSLSLSILGFVLPIIPGLFFLILAVLFLVIAIPKQIKTLPGIRWLINKRKTLGKEEFQMKLFTFLTIKVLIVFLIIAIIIKNTEFIYYYSLFLPLVLIIYFIHRKIRLHLPIFIMVCLMFIMGAAGGILYFGGARLYDIVFFGFLRYDQLVHLVGIFTISFLVYNLIYKYIELDKEGHNIYLFVILVLMSAGVGTLIELGELIAVVFFGAAKGVGDYMNNVLDLLYNLVGAILASLIVVLYHKNKFFKDIIMKGKVKKFLK